MEDAVILYPSTVIGHLISMVEFGKLILTHSPSLSINILITPLTYNVCSTASYINHVSATTSITFHHLPAVSLHHNDSPHHETLALELLNNPNVHRTITSISTNVAVCALVMDFFCYPALAVAVDLNLPAYFFFTFGPCCLASFLHTVVMHQTITESLKDLDTNLDILGLPPISSADMPNLLQDRNDKAYKGFLNTSIDMPKSTEIIVNTFESLERRALKTITDGLCVLDDEITLLFYCIGPLVAANINEIGGNGGGASNKCLTWLDLQPSRSVVFLCSGSMGLFSAKQLKEIVVGLERSGKGFLWVVRSPPSEED